MKIQWFFVSIFTLNVVFFIFIIWSCKYNYLKIQLIKVQLKLKENIFYEKIKIYNQ